ncbi:hypothetical protein ACFXTH_035392 [Malus domestica]
MWYLALEIRRTMLLRFLRKQSWWGSGSRDSESSVSSIFEKVIMLGVWLSRFGRRCLFDFGVSNLVGSVFSDVSKGWACLLVYLATKHGERCSGSCKLHVLNFGRDFDKVICGTHELLLRVGSADKARKEDASLISEIGPRDSGSSVSSIFEKVIMLGVWLSRFGGRCLFDFGASNLVGSVFSNSDVVGAASFTCSTLAENFGKVICEVFDRIPIISAKLSVRVTGADKAGKVGASSISEIGPRGP